MVDLQCGFQIGQRGGRIPLGRDLNRGFKEVRLFFNDSEKTLTSFNGIVISQVAHQYEGGDLARQFCCGLGEIGNGFLRYRLVVSHNGQGWIAFVRRGAIEYATGDTCPVCLANNGDSAFAVLRNNDDAMYTS